MNSRNRTVRKISLLGALLVSLTAGRAAAEWRPVAPMDWSKVSLSDFKDSELEVPYLLNHFATIANSVVESGPNRGFLAIRVNREPKDNEPYNARIQENALSLAYFYSTRRDWNPYFGDESVRVRLEAMMAFWCSIQHAETGLFSEYGPSNFSLAPTGFGIMHMARTLELVSQKDVPPIDKAIFDRTLAAQRKAIMAMLTRDEIFKMGSGWSNQWSGVLLAASTYLDMRPDDLEMRAAFLPAVERAAREFQSPAGFLYESHGPDIGYSSVHETNVRIAWEKLSAYPEIRKAIVDEDQRYIGFVSHQIVPQPGTNAYFTNAGINTRTQHAYQLPKVRPIAESSPLSRALATTTTELIDQASQRRSQLAKDWPEFKALEVPSAYSYIPTPLFTATADYHPWCPTPEEREKSIAGLPCNSAVPLTRIAYDDRRDLGFIYVRRPAYYTIFNFGKPAAPHALGLGILWNPKFGVAIQSVAASDWKWGTAVDEKRIREQLELHAAVRVADTVWKTPTAGYEELPQGAVEATYDLDGGTKTVRFDDNRVVIAIRKSGSISEQVPLVLEKRDEARMEGKACVVTRGNQRMIIQTESAALSLGKPTALLKGSDQFSRIELQLVGSDSLEYTIAFETR